MLPVIAVVGTGRNSGKTTTVEALVKELSRRGYSVGVVKQIHEEDFSIDTEGKDTWRAAEAGAAAVVCAAPREVALIKRLRSEERFAEAMNLLATQKLDLVVVEGNPPANVPRIFAAREQSAAKKLIQKIGGKILFVSSLSPEKFRGRLEAPVLNPKKDARKMAELLEESVLK